MAEEGVTQLTIEGPIGQFYKKLEPLVPDRHGALGLKKTEAAFGFTKQVHWCPITSMEVPAASLHYPVVFAGEERYPIAVMGLREGENLFFDENGLIEPEGYVPGFFRRYPFALATSPDGQQQIVCIDMESSLVTSDSPDFRLFDNGQPTKYFADTARFLRAYQTDLERTREFGKTALENDLFEMKSVTYSPKQGGDGGQPEMVKVADYYSITPEKVAKLSPEKLAEFRDNGMLMLIYSHLLSLGNWQKLINRAMRKQAKK